MKIRKVAITVASTALLAGLVISPVRAEDKNLRATLEGYQEAPPVSTEAGGEFRARISKDGTMISYDLSYEALEGNVTQAHIHFGQVGVSANIVVWLCQTPPAFTDPTGLSPTCPQQGTVSGVLTAANMVANATPQGIAPGEFAELVRAIRAGRAYANIHSSKFPSGEIRGQLK